MSQLPTLYGLVATTHFLLPKLPCVMSPYIALMLWELVLVSSFVWPDHLEVICTAARYDVTVWNRSTSKCDPLISEGAK